MSETTRNTKPKHYQMNTYQKQNAYYKGQYACEAPPVCHEKWTAGDWIKWIDSNGKWTAPLEIIDAFARAYIECALWSTGNPNDAGDNPEMCDRAFDVESMPAALKSEMISDCQVFQKDNESLLVDLDDAQSGHDFWLTREGHGAGFLDRGLGELGDKLTKSAKAWGNGSDAFYQHEWNATK